MEKKTIERWLRALTGAGVAAALVACGGGGGGGGAGGGVTPTGTLQLSVTDAPACYESVKVNVAKVRVHASDDTGTGDADGAWREVVPPNAPVQIDLVKLTNGQIQELGSAVVPAGTYRQLRLVLAATGNSVTPVGGTPQDLKTPSGQQSGLKIKADFTVGANAVSDLLMDFDACKSVVLTGNGQYILKPVVRLSAKPAGAIQGFVGSSVAQGTGTATLSSINVSAQQNGAVVRSTIPDASGRFVLSYLPAGTYTVVITGSGLATGTGTAPDLTRGAATRVVDGVPVGTSPVNLNTSTNAIALSASAMGTVTGTVSPGTTGGSTTIADNATVSALQTVATRVVEVNSTRPDDQQEYRLLLPLAAPELQLFATTGLQAPAPDAADAAKYTIRVSGPGLATKESPADLGTGPKVVDFTY